jgi:hypothetical protein
MATMAVKKQITGEIGIFIYWVVNAAYAFHFWGIGWGLLNLPLPIAMIADALQFLINLTHPLPGGLERMVN